MTICLPNAKMMTVFGKAPRKNMKNIIRNAVKANNKNQMKGKRVSRVVTPTDKIFVGIGKEIFAYM